ncbi:hypothetical protein DFJ73DRAFT_756139 [Zopfochytrium polystomum]|nr:hypothetical protein DFJ73DRAFT_756139 [Zopfochytrium polystomum]
MAGKEDVAQSTFWFGAVGVGFVYLLAVAKLTRSVRETLSDYERNWAAPNLSYHMDHVGLFSPSRGPILIISGTAFDAPPPMRQTRRLPPPGPPRPSAVTFAGSSTASLYDGNDYVGNGLMDGPAELSLFYRPPAHAYFPSYRGHVPRATYPLLAGGGGGRGVSAASLDPVPAYAPPAAAVEDAGGGDAGGGGGVRGAGAGGRVGWAGMQEPAPAYTPRDAGGVGGVVGRGQGGAAE